MPRHFGLLPPIRLADMDEPHPEQVARDRVTAAYRPIEDGEPAPMPWSLRIVFLICGLMWGAAAWWWM